MSDRRAGYHTQTFGRRQTYVEPAEPPLRLKRARNPTGCLFRAPFSSAGAWSSPPVSTGPRRQLSLALWQPRRRWARWPRLSARSTPPRRRWQLAALLLASLAPTPRAGPARRALGQLRHRPTRRACSPCPASDRVADDA